MDPCIESFCEACLTSWNRKRARYPEITYAAVVEQRRSYGACTPKQQCGDVHALVGRGACRCGKVMPAGIKRDSVDDIINAVCREHGVSRAVMTGKSQELAPAEARHDACYLLRQHTRLTLTSVAALMGRRDHTTVIHSVRKSKALCAKFTACKNRMERIVESLNA